MGNRVLPANQPVLTGDKRVYWNKERTKLLWQGEAGCKALAYGINAKVPYKTAIEFGLIAKADVVEPEFVPSNIPDDIGDVKPDAPKIDIAPVKSRRIKLGASDTESIEEIKN